MPFGDLDHDFLGGEPRAFDKTDRLFHEDGRLERAGVDIQEQFLLRPQFTGIAHGEAPAQCFDILQEPRVLGETENGLGIVEVAALRPPDERFPPQGMARPQRHDRLVENVEGGPPDEVPEFGGQMVRLEIDVVLDELAGLDDGVVDLALQVVRLPENRGIPDAHRKGIAERLGHFIVEPFVEFHERHGVMARKSRQVEGTPHFQDHQEVVLPEGLPVQQPRIPADRAEARAAPRLEHAQDAVGQLPVIHRVELLVSLEADVEDDRGPVSPEAVFDLPYQLAFDVLEVIVEVDAGPGRRLRVGVLDGIQKLAENRPGHRLLFS